MILRILKWLGSAIVVVLLLIAVLVFVAYWRSTSDCGQSAEAGARMKAVVYCDYGGPEVLQIAEVSKPTPTDDQVLIRVQVAAINPLDWHFLHGTPYLMRMESGLRKPKSGRIGVDYAGTVEAVGRNVTAFKPGDEVFGEKNGALAEYICVGADRAVVLKPTNLTLEQASGIGIAGVTALQGLRDIGHVQAGQKVLINGASGGVGTFAVQIARSLGANVTGVCSTRNVAMVRELGAHQVIDYTKEDFTQGAERYDVILDCVGTQPLAGFRRALTPKGICVLIGGGGPDDGNWIGPLSRPIKALFMAPFVSQTFTMMMAEPKQSDLKILADLMQAGKVTPVIDRRFKLSEVVDAFRYLEKGHARGKVLILVAENGRP